MTLEERVERLENFIGDMDRIATVYANSLQQICDKYLNLLYIEPSHELGTNILLVDGFLADLDHLPINTVFNVRPSHGLIVPSGQVSKIRFKKGTEYVEMGLKKFDIENPGNTVYLSDGDFRQGSLYSIYIPSQGDGNPSGFAIITSNDAGEAALTQVQTLATTVSAMQTVLSGIANFSTGGIEASSATIASLNVTDSLALTNPVNLPATSTVSTPTTGDNTTKIATTAFVKTAIDNAISEYHRKFHIIDNVAPEVALENAEEKAIYYRY